MPTGFYLTYANAPATGPGINTAGVPNNMFNGGTLDRHSVNIAAEFGVVPEKVTVGAALRFAKSGWDKGVINGLAANNTNASDNAIFLTATYKLAQNLLTRFSYVKQRGDLWTAAYTNAVGSQSYTVNLYALF